MISLTQEQGWKLTNTRVLADAYAEEAGVRVYVPDFFGGDHAPFSMEVLKALWVFTAAQNHSDTSKQSHGLRQQVYATRKARRG